MRDRRITLHNFPKAWVRNIPNLLTANYVNIIEGYYAYQKSNVCKAKK